MSREQNRNREYDSVAEQGTGGSSKLSIFCAFWPDRVLWMHDEAMR